MRKILLSLFLISLIFCSNSLFAQKKLSKKERTEAAVATQMFRKSLTIYITNVISDMGVQSYQEGIKVTLINDIFNCNLPFMGDASVNTYGSNNLSIVCDSQKVEIESEFVDKKKYYQLNFTFTSKFDNEKFDADLKVFTNGKVTLSVYSAKRSVMRYTGGLLVNI